MSRKLSLLLIVYSLGLTLLNVAWVAKKGGPRYVLEQLGVVRYEHVPADFQVDSIKRFRSLPDMKDEIVFAGDSITAEMYPLESYTDIRNRGIGGDNSDGLLDRLDEITASRPKQVFLNIGTNDLAREVSAEEVAENIRTIIDRIAAASPGTEIFVASVLPINLDFDRSVRVERKLVEIGRLNAMLAEASRAGKFTYLDLWSKFKDEKGYLRRDMTTDGTHLNDDGKQLYCELLEPYVKSKELLVRRGLAKFDLSSQTRDK